MAKQTNVLAFDFGASGGRAVLAGCDGKKIVLKEIHRFSNDPVMVNGSMYWDVLRLFYEIKQGLFLAKQECKIDSIGIDTWGVDFALLDKDGRMLENPVHYRDKRTVGMLQESFKLIDKKLFYEVTGNQFIELNTVFQLLSLCKNRAELINNAKTLLLMPDLFNYMLSGKKQTELSIASTTQLLNSERQIWSEMILDTLEIPAKLFTEIVKPGTKIGDLSDDIAEELQIEKMPIIAVAGHDTQSAMMAVPTQAEEFIFLSCGTWSLLGTEMDKPIINNKSQQYNMTNEIGYAGRTAFLKNIIGLWLVQESRRQWQKEGRDFSYSELEQMAKKAAAFKCLIDPDAPEFISAGNMPERIRKYCQKTNQYIPQTEGEIVRCINESLAFKYHHTILELEDCVPHIAKQNIIYMIGGGINSSLLCQLTASACNKTVKAGPIEATVYGNVAAQLIALGVINNLQEARKIIEQSEQMFIFEPQDRILWEAAYKKWKELILC